MVMQIEARIAERLQPVPQTEAERQMNIWQGFYDFINERSGLQLTVPPLDRTEAEVKELEARGRMLVYVHPEISTAKAIPTLALTLPGVDSRVSNKYKNKIDQHGWLDVEKSVETPHVGISPEETIQKLKEDGLEPQTVNTYLIASVFSRFINGEYFDPTALDKQGARGASSLLAGTGFYKYPASGEYSTTEGLLKIWRYARSLGLPSDVLGVRSAGRKRTLTPVQETVGQSSEQEAGTSIEAILDGLGIEDGMERLEITLGILGALDHHGIENAGTDTIISEALARQIASGILATRTIQEVAIPDDDEEEAANEEPDDVELALIEAENRRSTVFTRGDIFQESEGEPQVIAGQHEEAVQETPEIQDEKAQIYTAIDLLANILPQRATLTQRLQAKNTARELGMNPDKVTKDQRTVLESALRRKFGK